MSTRHRLVAASPPWVAARLAAPALEAPVVHRGADAVYVDAGGTVLAVLSASATSVPCGLRIAAPRLPADVAAAPHAAVGGGVLALGETDVLATRFWDPSVPVRRDRDHAAARVRLAATLQADPAAERMAAVAGELPRDALERLTAVDASAVAPLLGLGSGLTPVGDDVLCGALATLVSADRLPMALADTVRRLAPGRTTALSVTLLHCAERGEVLPEFRRLLVDLDAPDADHPTDGGPGPLATDVADLLRVGHTSGAGLLLGATLALRHLASRSPVA